MHGQTEFRYRDHSARDHAAYLLMVGLWLLFASLITGAWGIVALVHASWLDTNDLYAGNATSWGIVLLCIASLQGISGLLVMFDRPSGAFLGIAISLVSVVAHLGVIGAYPIWSIAAIVVDLVVISILVAYRRRR